MADQALNATFFAFRKREKGGVLLRATVAFGAGMVILFALFGAAIFAIVGPTVLQFLEILSSNDPSALGNTSPAALSGIFWIFPLEMIFLFAVFVWMAAYEAACLRWMIHGESGGGILGLRFDAVMWRVYATYWVWLGLFVALYFVCAIAVIVGSVGTAASTGDAGAGGLVALVLTLTIIVGLIFFGVRFAPASAASVARRRFSFFSAWAVTKGRFWALFGSFLLIIMMNIVASIILSTIFISVLFAGVFADLDWTTVSTNPEAFSQAYLAGIMRLWSDPTSIALLMIYYAVAGAVSLVFYILFYGVSARAAALALEEGKLTAAS